MLVIDAVFVQALGLAPRMIERRQRQAAAQPDEDQGIAVDGKLVGAAQRKQVLGL
jgi:hypothetical protein